MQNSASQSSSSEIDEGPAAKLARFTSELIAENNQRKTITNQTKKKQYEHSNANQSDDEVSIFFFKRIDCTVADVRLFALATTQDEHYFYPTYFDETLTDSKANGFDADSEGSDYEIVPNVNANRMSESIKMNTNQNGTTAADANGNPILSMLASPASPMAGANEAKTASLPASPVKASATLKRPHKSADTSNFNRSTRKSDHCATYYFRHPDTEPESGTNNGTGGDCSSQDATSDVYSEDDQWFYTNGNDGNENADGNPALMSNDAQHAMDELNGNESQNFDLTCVSMRVNCSNVYAADEVDSPAANGMVSFATCIRSRAGLLILNNLFVSFRRMAQPHTFRSRRRTRSPTHW